MYSFNFIFIINSFKVFVFALIIAYPVIVSAEDQFFETSKKSLDIVSENIEENQFESAFSLLDTLDLTLSAVIKARIISINEHDDALKHINDSDADSFLHYGQEKSRLVAIKDINASRTSLLEEKKILEGNLANAQALRKKAEISKRNWDQRQVVDEDSPNKDRMSLKFGEVTIEKVISKEVSGAQFDTYRLEFPVIKSGKSANAGNILVTVSASDGKVGISGDDVLTYTNEDQTIQASVIIRAFREDDFNVKISASDSVAGNISTSFISNLSGKKIEKASSESFNIQVVSKTSTPIRLIEQEPMGEGKYRVKIKNVAADRVKFRIWNNREFKENKIPSSMDYDGGQESKADASFLYLTKDQLPFYFQIIE